MPVGPFEDFEACVAHFGDDPNVEDAEALCGWMEQNKDAVGGWDPEEDSIEDLVDALNDPAAQKVLQNLKVTYVSGVEQPAQDSQWVMAKDASAEGADWGVTAPIVVKEGHVHEMDRADKVVQLKQDADEERKAWAPVLIPNETDKQGDVIPPGEIETAAHDFLAKFRNIDTDHDLLEGKGTPIESWTLKEDQTFSIPDGGETREYPEGTWMLGVQFNDAAWERVKAGELSGFSIYGEAENIPVEEILGEEMADVARSAKVELAKGLATDRPPEDLVDAQETIAKVAEEAGLTPGEVLTSLTISGTDTEDGSMSDNASKQLEADALSQLAESLRAYFDEHGGEVETTSLEEFVEWAVGTPTADMDDTMEIGGVQIPIRPETEDEEQSTTMSETDTETEETEEETKESEGEDPSVEDMVKSIKSTVEDNNEDLNTVQEKQADLDERVTALEEEVGKSEESEADADAEGEDTEEEKDAEESGISEAELEEALAEATEEGAEKAVAKMLGVDPEDLPEDADERQEVVRKSLAEPGAAGEVPTGNGIEWDESDFEEVL